MLRLLRVSSRALSERALRTTCGSPRIAASLPGLQKQKQEQEQEQEQTRWGEGNGRLFSSITADRLAHTQTTPGKVIHDRPPPLSEEQRIERTKRLPVVCPGCGAHSQTVDPESAGYYDPARPRNYEKRKREQPDQDAIFRDALKRGDLADRPPSQPESAPGIPLCGRCHELLYQSKGNSIIHPSMQSIQAIIAESPHKHNHIYHVLDAADFPMSLIPNLQHALDLPRPRTRNRRSKSANYRRGRKAEVSFIITRSDILAPGKEQVDTLMPYLQQVLRDALGRSGRDLRLGNVRCVSSNRGWWTRTVKEEIWKRGGAGWMVGKVNVGKSALVEVVFPKGRSDREALEPVREAANDAERLPDVTMPTAASPGELAEQDAETAVSRPEQEPNSLVPLTDLPQHRQEEEDDDDDDDEISDPEPRVDSLLPPARPETAYPPMPLVSSLPGTTASPIRLPFGSGKGELIDLPGIHRSDLPNYIATEHHKELVLKSRVVPEQHVLKPGQSLLLGGLIRITPTNLKEGSEVVLSYAFVPRAFTPHVTSTAKAIAIQTGVHSELSSPYDPELPGQPYMGNVPTISTPEAKENIQKAGTFRLEWDVTKARAGPLTHPAAGKLKADKLPFIVYAADILIESVGWVELACQVRRRKESFLPSPAPVGTRDAFGEVSGGAGTSASFASGQDSGFPEVEVFSPEGKFVGVRRPMNAWLLNKKRDPVAKRRGRPRMTVDMMRRREGGRKKE
jgi:genetic interactor of prohibitins 3, mitochondrial